MFGALYKLTIVIIIITIIISSSSSIIIIIIIAVVVVVVVVVIICWRVRRLGLLKSAAEAMAVYSLLPD